MVRLCLLERCLHIESKLWNRSFCLLKIIVLPGPVLVIEVPHDKNITGAAAFSIQSIILKILPSVCQLQIFALNIECYQLVTGMKTRIWSFIFSSLCS